MFLRSFCFMLYSTEHTNEVTNQTPFVHLNTFINQFQIRFKTCLQQKYNAETVCHLFLRRHHSHNRRVQNISFIKPECFLWYRVDCRSLNTNNCSFWTLNNRCWRCNSVLPQRLRGTYCRKSSLHTFGIVNTMERRMHNFK